MADADRCVMCGAIIPEGRMICPTCEKLAETCQTCKWHDDLDSVCFEGYSPNVGDVTENNDTCDFWAQKYPSAMRKGT